MRCPIRRFMVSKGSKESAQLSININIPKKKGSDEKWIFQLFFFFLLSQFIFSIQIFQIVKKVVSRCDEISVSTYTDDKAYHFNKIYSVGRCH